MHNSDISNRMKQATKWSSITEIVAKLGSPITNMILARILAPEVFGVVATLTMVVSFAEIFTDAGFQKYLVQHEFIDEQDLNQSTNVAFWTNLVFSMAVWFGIAFFSEPIAALVGSPGCEKAICVISMEIPLLAFSSIQMARYRRDFNFKGLFVARMATTLVPFVITVPLALAFRSYWALVWGTLARDILNAVILTVKSHWKPSFQYSFTKLKEMLSFSIWTIVENVTIWLASYVGMFIVGIALNEYYLGLYKTTMNMVNGIMGIITSATIPVLFSALSRYQNDEVLFQETFFRFQRIAALLVIPLGFGMYVYRELGVAILLGSQWGDAENFFGMWSLTSALTIVMSYYDSEVFRSKGKPKLSVLSQCLHLAFLIPLLIWSKDKGFTVLTTTRSLVRLQGIAVSACIMHFILGIRIPKVIINILPSFVAACVMAIAGTFLRTVFDNIVWEIFTILLCVLIYAVVTLLIPAGRKQLAEIPVLQRLLKLKSEQNNIQ